MQSDYRLFAQEVSENLDNLATRDPSVITVFQQLSNDEFVNPQDRYMPFLSDPVIQSFANLNFEYRIEDQLITHVNNEQFFISDISDGSLTQTIRTFPKGDKIDLTMVPDNIVIGYDNDSTTIVTRNCNCNVNITRPNCDEVRIFGNCTESTTNISSSVTLKVSLTGYGNTDIDNRTFPVAGNFDFTVNTSTYPNFNSSTGQAVNLFFKVEAGAECGDTDEAQIAFKPLDGMCDDSDRETIWDWKEDGGSQAISFRTNHHKGWYHGYEQTKVYSYWWNGTTWKNTNSKLKAKIVSKRQNSVCSLSDGEQETKDCDHCKSIQASVNSYFWWFCDDDVVGTVEKKLTWQGNTWTIDAVQSVDFECCE